MDVPITTTTASKQLNSLLFHGDDKYITANGQTIINAGTDKIRHVTIIHFGQKFYWKY